MKFQSDKPGEFDDANIAFETAISALEEVQQYWALGTVEELRKAREKQIPSVWIPCRDRLPENSKHKGRFALNIAL